MDNGIVSHQHAWLWGMLLTDGHIAARPRNHSIRWRQKYDSYTVLEKLRNIIGSTHNITFVPNGKNGKYMASLLNITNKNLALTAIGILGCHPSRKTFDLKFPNVDPAFLPSLIRGIHDGDGSWSFNCRKYAQLKFVIVSANVRFLESIKSCINKYALQTDADAGKLCLHGNNCYVLNYTAQSHIQTIGNWMYNSEYMDGAFMERKYNRFVLFDKIFLNETSIPSKDRVEQFMILRETERKEAEQQMQSLILMSQGQIRCPEHFHFSPGFFRKFVANPQ